MPSKIEWCDETLNPQGWGCYGPGGTPEKPQRCWYCYARRFATRNTRGCAKCAEFIPHWHPEQLEKPLRWRKSRKIFWQSMGDLFHPYSPQNQILAVKDMAKATPQHIHIFLTQNTSRLREFNPWPPNCWVGTTITNQEHMNERVGYLLNADAKVRFISHEPLMSEIKQSQAWWKKVSPLLHWTIIGDMTGPGAVKLNLSWIFNLVGQYREAGVPIFLKNNCPWPGAKKIQEWPA